MNEFAEDDAINMYINTVYQSMYKKTDRGVRNGEVELVINIQAQENEQYIANQIKQYFNSFYSNKTLKKYYISIDIKDRELHINLKWGHHAIVANNNNIGEPLDQL